MIAANIWPIFLRGVSAPLAAVAELVFLGTLRLVGCRRRAALAPGPLLAPTAFRNTRPHLRAMGLGAAGRGLLRHHTVHSAIVILFRFVPYPVAMFRKGYDISFVPTGARCAGSYAPAMILGTLCRSM